MNKTIACLLLALCLLLMGAAMAVLAQPRRKQSPM